jgi:hypothetical protein
LGVGFWRGRRDFGRGQPLFRSFKKIRKGFWGIILSNFKVSPNWGVLKSETYFPEKSGLFFRKIGNFVFGKNWKLFFPAKNRKHFSGKIGNFYSR